MSKVYILGAGVDATTGIQLPLTSELLPRITEFASSEDGKVIEAKIRSFFPGLRFRFDTFIQNAIDNIARSYKDQLREIVTNVSHELDQNQALSEEDKKLGQLIKVIFEKVNQLQNGVELDEDTAALIQEVMGAEFHVADNSIVDMSRIVFTDTFKAILRQVLTMSLQDPTNPILQHVYRDMLDFEDLLQRYFIGFYVGKEFDIKIYSYIAWMLWAYLVYQEKKIYSKEAAELAALPVYSKIEQGSIVITFNYTSFAHSFGSRHSFKSLYFHGSILSCVDIKSKNDINITIDDRSAVDILSFVDERIKQNISFEDTRRYAIPTFLPPVNIKPVLTKDNIKDWYESMDAMRNADKIIIIGYSFNKSDEHFNGMLRECVGKDIVIVDPQIDKIRARVNGIFHYNNDDYSAVVVQGKPTTRIQRLTIIKAEAHEIDITTL